MLPVILILVNKDYQRMANVPNGVEILPEISTPWVGCTSVTDRQTTDRQTDDRRTSLKRKKKFLLRFVDSHNLLCNVFRITWPTKIWRPRRTDTHCVMCQVFVLILIICSQSDSIAHALLRCDIAGSNIWYIILSHGCVLFAALFYYGCPIIFLPCGFYLSIYLSIFFPRLILAATDWMSTHGVALVRI